MVVNNYRCSIHICAIDRDIFAGKIFHLYIFHMA